MQYQDKYVPSTGPRHSIEHAREQLAILMGKATAAALTDDQVRKHLDAVQAADINGKPKRVHIGSSTKTGQASKAEEAIGELRDMVVATANWEPRLDLAFAMLRRGDWSSTGYLVTNEIVPY